MICYTHGFTKEINICEVVDYEAICYNHQHCMERLTPMRHYYLDLDMASESTNSREFQQEDKDLLSLSLDLIQKFDSSLQCRSVCTSSLYQIQKHSFHLVFDRIGGFEDIKSWCKALNAYSLENQGPKFDESVYSSYQLFRSAHCSKPEDIRIKRILKGTFEESIISAGFTKSLIVQKVFDLPEIVTLSNDYSSWLEIGMLFAYYCKEEDLHPIEGLSAFIEFSNLSSNPASKKQLINKFVNLLRTVKFNPYHKIFNNVSRTDTITLFPNTYGEYLLITCINNVPDFSQRIMIEFGNDVNAIYSLLLNSTSHIEHEYYKLLYSLPSVDKSMCFEFTENNNISLFRCLKTLLKYDVNYESKKFFKNPYHCAVQAREFITKTLDKIEFYVGVLYLPVSDCYGDAYLKIKEIASVELSKLWNVQYPYQKTLSQIWNECKENDLQFRLLINRACEKIFGCEQYFHFFSNVSTDCDAAKIVFNLYPFWRVNSHDELYAFDDVHGLWTPKANIHTYIVTRLANFLYKVVTRKGVENFALSNCLNKKILDRLPSFIEILSKKKEFDDLKYSSIGKLLFPNGYYDGYNSLFVPAFYIIDTAMYGPARFVFFNYDLYFFASVPDFYVDKIDHVEEELSRMREILFYQMHGKEIGDYHLESLACALFGEKHKGFYVHVGDTNSGKSTEKALIEASFGEYCGTGNTEDFAVVKNDNREATITNAFVVDNWFKRAVFFSEKGTRILNTEMLKSHSSGGEDKLRSRKQYGVAAIYSIHYKMFFYVNEGLVVNNPNDPAYIDRARYFYWNKSFVPQEDIVDPSCQLPQLPEVQNWKNEKCRRQLFVRIIIDAFNKYIERGHLLPVPDGVMLSTREEVGHAMSNDEVFERLMYAFLFTGNSQDVLIRDQINLGCEQLKLPPKKCTQKINAMMAKLGIKTIRSAQKTICGERQSVWIGVQIRPISVALVSEYSPLVNFEKWKDIMTDYNGVVPSTLIESLSNYLYLDESSEYYKYLTPAQVDGTKKRRRII
jgi:hypothetical protein